MRNKISLLTLLLVMILLVGCSGKPSDDSMNQLADHFSRTFETTELPQSALESMQNLIDNFTGGVKIPTNTVTKVVNPTGISYPTQAPATASGTPTPTTNTSSTTGSSAPYGKCSTLEEALENEKYYLTNVDETFTIIITSTTDYSGEMIDYLSDDFDGEFPIESMYFRHASLTYSQTSTETVYNFQIMHDKPADEVREDIKAAKQEVDNINSALSLDGLSTYDALDRINEYLCDLVVYPDTQPYSDESYTVYGAVVEKEAVCEGYAKTAKALMDMNGIESYFITGNTSGGAHAWNLVKVDGNWYHLDTTWNDSGGDRKTYFLVSDNFMSYSRTWDTSRFPATPQDNY